MSSTPEVSALLQQVAENLPKALEQEQARKDARPNLIAGQLERIGDILEASYKLALLVSQIDPSAIADLNIYGPDDEESKAAPEILTTPEHEIAETILKEREMEKKGFTEDKSQDDWPEDGPR